MEAVRSMNFLERLKVQFIDQFYAKEEANDLERGENKGAKLLIHRQYPLVRNRLGNILFYHLFSCKAKKVAALLE